MAKRKLKPGSARPMRGRAPKSTSPDKPASPGKKIIGSFHDVMKDGAEYASIVSHAVQSDAVLPDLRRAVADIEAVRDRRCICYIANVLTGVGDPGLTNEDLTPLSELMDTVPKEHKAVDVLLVTPGGVAQCVDHIVHLLRQRFESVEYLLPDKAMSAGTLWVLSGDKIWMDNRARLGPLDPQVPSKNGQLVPAQSLFALLRHIREEVEKAKAGGQPIPVDLVGLLNTMEHKEVGAAILATDYVEDMAAGYLEKFKFRNWLKHSNGDAVTSEHRRARARSIAHDLCNSEKWKSHGHGIARDVVETELRIKIERAESMPSLERALRRFWAICQWVFENSPTLKFYLSEWYFLLREARRRPGGGT